MSRKSASIVNMINRANHMLSAEMDHIMSPVEQVGFRKGVAEMLECTLHENGVYSGFSYLQSAGMVRHPEGHEHAGYFKSVEDDSRRKYHISSKLEK